MAPIPVTLNDPEGNFCCLNSLELLFLGNCTMY